MFRKEIDYEKGYQAIWKEKIPLGLGLEQLLSLDLSMKSLW
jgi:hypothetical protein